MCSPDVRTYVFARCATMPVIIRADTSVCPYMAYILDDCMEMIGHDHIFIASDILKFIFQFNIPFVHHPPCVIQRHLLVLDIAEQTFSVFGTNANKIRPGSGIIIPLQTNRSAVGSGFHI